MWMKAAYAEVKKIDNDAATVEPETLVCIVINEDSQIN